MTKWLKAKHLITFSKICKKISLSPDPKKILVSYNLEQSSLNATMTFLSAIHVAVSWNFLHATKNKMQLMLSHFYLLTIL